jgi:hypothetical protein
MAHISAEEKDRLEICAKQLDRILGFFPRVESKASFLFAVNSTMLGVLALNVQRVDFFSWSHGTAAAATVGLLAASLWFIYRCTFPNLAGGHASLIYFREIAQLREAEFIVSFKSLPSDRLFDDLASQVWRNSEILTVKFRSVKLAFTLTALSLVPWTVFLVFASITHSQFPVVK